MVLSVLHARCYPRRAPPLAPPRSRSVNFVRPTIPPPEQPLSEDPTRSWTMPSRYYTDPDVYEEEKQVIFAWTWHYVGHLSRLKAPGDYLTLEIADESVFVMRGEDGQLRCFFNVCRHRGPTGSSRARATRAPWCTPTTHGPTRATGGCAMRVLPRGCAISMPARCGCRR